MRDNENGRDGEPYPNSRLRPYLVTKRRVLIVLATAVLVLFGYGIVTTW